MGSPGSTGASGECAASWRASPKLTLTGVAFVGVSGMVGSAMLFSAIHGNVITIMLLDVSMVIGKSEARNWCLNRGFVIWVNVNDPRIIRGPYGGTRKRDTTWKRTVVK